MARRYREPGSAGDVKGSLRSSKDLITEALKLRGLTDALRAHSIASEWKHIVGAKIAARSWPDGLSKRVLWVRVISSPWMQELTILKAALTTKIVAAVGEPSLFDEVRLHLGTRARDADDLLADAQLHRRPPAPKKPLPPPASPQAIAAIEAETAGIADDELREAIRRVRIRHDK